MNTKWKNIIAIIISICISTGAIFGTGIGSTDSAMANETEYGVAVFSIEKFTVGQGYLVEPVIVTIESGETCDVVFDRVITAAGYEYDYSGDIGSGFYLASIKNADSGILDIPECISSIDGAPSNASNTGNEAYPALGEFAYSEQSGWCYSVNNEFPPVSMSDYELQDNDVFRVQFTVYGYGADIGNAFGEDVNYEIADKDELTYAIAKINQNYDAYMLSDGMSAAYENAMEVLKTVDSTQSLVDDAYQTIENIIKESGIEDTTEDDSSKEDGTGDDDAENNNEDEITTQDNNTEETATDNTDRNDSTDLYTVLTEAADYIVSLETDSGPDSQWNIIGLARFGADISQEIYDTFYENCAQYVVENEGVLTTSKYTEYSKLILSMTAIGRNAQNISGYNLFYYLSDFDNVKKQGINGPIWALIALNSNDEYEIPENTDAGEITTERVLIDYILEKQNGDGGYALSKTESDVDLTAMAVTALAPYYNIDSEVTESVDMSLAFLSGAQNESTGEFSSYGYDNVESSAQVLVALCALSIDVADDSRFIKNDISLIDVICSYQKDNGGFSHLKSASVNGMATEQAFYALTAYYRFINGKTALFDMNDLTLTDGEAVTVEAVSETESAEENTAQNTTESTDADTGEDTTENPDTDTGKSTAENETEYTVSVNSDTSVSEKTDGWSFDGESYTAEEQSGEQEDTDDAAGVKNIIIILIVFIIIAIGGVIWIKRKK